MKVYRLYLAKPLLIFYLVMLIAFPLAFVVLSTCAAFGSFRDAPPTIVFVIGLPLALYCSYRCLGIPFEIRVEKDTAEFRSVLGKRVIPLSEISSIRTRRFSPGYVGVTHANGTIYLINQMDGFHEFVTTVKSLNPSVIVEGC
jgi:hypothetical protein